MAGRSSKPIQLVKGHRTKAEKKIRAESEASSLTGKPMSADDKVKNYPEALREFNRLKKLFKMIKKDDALYEAAINTYSILKADCDLLYIKRNKTSDDEQWFKYDKAIMDKQKMMLAIEKENIMTIASALRSIPKKPEKAKTVDPMEALLNGVM